MPSCGVLVQGREQEKFAREAKRFKAKVATFTVERV